MSTDVQADVAVIGAGPGGYVAAIRAAQLGLRVAVIEKEFVGGTCLNVGCIPSKALLDASHLFSEIKRASVFGIQVEGASVDFATMQRYKYQVVKALTTGVRGLLKRHGVKQLDGTARFMAPGVLDVQSPKEPSLTVCVDNVIIATGSVPLALPGVPFDDNVVISSRRALELETVPDRLVVIGAGYIGLELASVYSRLGTEVVVLEMMDRVLPDMDAEVAALAHKLLGQQGLDIRLGARVIAVDVEGDSARVRYSVKDGEAAVEAPFVLVSVGRCPATDGLGLDVVGLEVDDLGFIMVDHGMRTGVPGIYAIGDIITSPMLAHVAMDEGIVAAECIAGRAAAMEYDAIPAVVFTHPELASVGLHEDEAELRGHNLKVGRFPFRGNGRARARDDMEGWVKVIADADTDVILGVHCVGPEAGHLIHEAVVAMGYGGYAEDLAVTVHAHPTLSEAFKEAALAVDGRPLHI